MASDHELDLEFRASANSTKSVRPTSTLARAFANQLNDIFLLDDQLDRLDQSVSRKKQSVSYQNSELALLEARIKQAEKLLEEKKQRLAGREPSRTNVPDYAPNPTFSATSVAAKEDAAAATNGEAVEEAAKTGGQGEVNGDDEKGKYQVRPPPPPPSVPATI